MFVPSHPLLFLSDCSRRSIKELSQELGASQRVARQLSEANQELRKVRDATAAQLTAEQQAVQVLQSDVSARDSTLADKEQALQQVRTDVAFQHCDM